MKKEVITLAHYRMERAQEAFQDGVRLLESGSLKGAANRLYYAAFYAAKAILALKALDSSKHSGVISLFNRHFVKTGLILPAKAKTLKKLFEKRQDIDYADFTEITRPEAEDLKTQTRVFIDECAAALNRLSVDKKKTE